MLIVLYPPRFFNSSRLDGPFKVHQNGRTSQFYSYVLNMEHDINYIVVEDNDKVYGGGQ